MIDKIQNAFVSVFGEEIRDEITSDATMDSVAAWDSLSFINVMLAVESEFGVSIEPDDAFEMTSVEGILGVISRKSS